MCYATVSVLAESNWRACKMQGLQMNFFPASLQIKISSSLFGAPQNEQHGLSLSDLTQFRPIGITSAIINTPQQKI
jgi:hypothetical protein